MSSKWCYFCVITFDTTCTAHNGLGWICFYPAKTNKLEKSPHPAPFNNHTLLLRI